MKYLNSLGLTPIKCYDVNPVISEINAQLARPCILSIFSSGRLVNTNQGLTVLTDAVFIPLLRMAPRIRYEITGVGRKPSDDNALISGFTANCYTLVPFVQMISDSSASWPGAVAINTATQFCDLDFSRSIPISVGSYLETRPEPNPAIFSHALEAGCAVQNAMRFGLQFRAPGSNVAPVVDTPKAAPAAISYFYAPMFTMNITIDFEEQL